MKQNCLTKCYNTHSDYNKIAKVIRSFFSYVLITFCNFRQTKSIFRTFINVILDCNVRTGIEIQKPCTGAPDRKQLRGLVAKWPGGGKLK